MQAEEQLYAAQQALVQTQVDQLNSMVQLYRALGGGWRQQETTATAAVSSVTAPPAVEKAQQYQQDLRRASICRVGNANPTQYVV